MTLAEVTDLWDAGRAYVKRRFPEFVFEADDALQEVTLRLIETDTRNDGGRALFFTALKNEMIDRVRKSKSRAAISLDALQGDTSLKVEQANPEYGRPVGLDLPTGSTAPEMVEEQLEARFELDEFFEALSLMRPNYARAVVARALGLTIPKIGKLEGVSLPGAKKLVFRSERQLRKRLEDLREGPERERRDLLERLADVVLETADLRHVLGRLDAISSA